MFLRSCCPCAMRRRWRRGDRRRSRRSPHRVALARSGVGRTRGVLERARHADFGVVDILVVIDDRALDLDERRSAGRPVGPTATQPRRRVVLPAAPTYLRDLQLYDPRFDRVRPAAIAFCREPRRRAAVCRVRARPRRAVRRAQRRAQLRRLFDHHRARHRRNRNELGHPRRRRSATSEPVPVSSTCTRTSMLGAFRSPAGRVRRSASPASRSAAASALWRAGTVSRATRSPECNS